MPVLYFHFDDSFAVLDSCGVDLPDTAAVRAEAIATIADILRDGDVRALWDGRPFRLWVTDQPAGKGATLFALHVRAIGVAGGD